MTTTDFYRSRLRVAGLVVVACGVVAFCTWAIFAHPGTGRRAVTPGSFNEFIAYCGVLFFGYGAVMAIFSLFERGPRVSVGPQGIFDRRISTGWIPWEAISNITPLEIRRNRYLVIDVYSSVEEGLPWKRRARLMSCINRSFGSHGYWISASELRGGFSALSKAVFYYRQKT